MIGLGHPAMQCQDSRTHLDDVWEYFSILLASQRETELKAVETNQFLPKEFYPKQLSLAAPNPETKSCTILRI